MSLVVKISIGLAEYETCGLVEAKFHTAARELTVLFVDYDAQYQSGLLYIRDKASKEPHCDLATGDVEWRGYEQSVWLVRQRSHENVELPSSAGAYLGKFPDPHVGRWLVFARVADRLPALRPVPRQGRPDSPAKEAPAIQAAGRSGSSSKAHSDNAWPIDESSTFTKE